LMSEIGDQPRCVLFNKSDLDQQWTKEKVENFLQGEKPIPLSAIKGTGLEDLKEAIYNHAIRGERAGESVSITRERHRDHLQQAAESLGTASANIISGCSEELIAVDVTLAMEHLGSVLGKTFSEDLLDKIFGQFCIGK
jgi:tRNA modification GTPase